MGALKNKYNDLRATYEHKDSMKGKRYLQCMCGKSISLNIKFCFRIVCSIYNTTRVKRMSKLFCFVIILTMWITVPEGRFISRNYSGRKAPSWVFGSGSFLLFLVGSMCCARASLRSRSISLSLGTKKCVRRSCIVWLNSLQDVDRTSKTFRQDPRLSMYSLHWYEKGCHGSSLRSQTQRSELEIH